MSLRSKDPSFFSEIPESIVRKCTDVDVIQAGVASPALQKFIMVGQSLDAFAVVKQFIDSKTRHLIQKNTSFFAEDLSRAILLSQKPNSFFSEPLGTMFEKPLDSVHFEFSSPKQKDELVKVVEDYVARFNNQNVKESARAIMEEMYMNAMISAPREAQKRGLGRNTYTEGLTAKFSLAHSSHFLALVCEDPFGALEIPKFLARMKNVYEQGAGHAINLEKEGGAGLGCVIMFEHTSSLFMGVIPEQQTLFSCIIPLGLNYRQRAAIGRSLHWIEPS